MIVVAASVVQGSAPVDSLCLRAESAFDEEKLDSAYYFYKKAWEQGMGKDSLYYFWSRVYTNRGILDTALALNLAVKGKVEPEKVYEQRYVIYKLLGWQEKANDILDSLNQIKGDCTPLGPSLTFGISTGMGRETYQNEHVLNYAKSDGEILPGFGAGATVNWKKRLSGATLNWGGRLLAEQYNLNADLKTEMDSFDLSGGVFLKALDIGGMCSFDANVSWLKYYDGVSSRVASADIIFRLPDVKKLKIVRAGVTVENNSESDQSQWSYSIDYNSYALANFGISYSGGVAILFSQDVFFTDTLPFKLFYYDDGTYYSDVTYQKKLATPKNPPELQSKAFPAALRTVFPGKVLSLSASVSPSFRLWRSLKGTVNLGWSVFYYPWEYQWPRLGFSLDSLASAAEYFLVADQSPLVVRNRLGGRYYLVEGFNEQDGSLVFREQALDMEVLREKRLDNELSFSVSFVQSLGIRNDLELSGSVARRFTSLSRGAPVIFVPFTFQTRLQWIMKLFSGKKP